MYAYIPILLYYIYIYIYIYIYKVFNKNNIKVSYGCMDNMTKIINSHKKYVSSKRDEANELTKS